MKTYTVTAKTLAYTKHSVEAESPEQAKLKFRESENYIEEIETAILSQGLTEVLEITADAAPIATRKAEVFVTYFVQGSDRTLAMWFDGAHKMIGLDYQQGEGYESSDFTQDQNLFDYVCKWASERGKSEREDGYFYFNTPDFEQQIEDIDNAIWAHYNATLCTELVDEAIDGLLKKATWPGIEGDCSPMMMMQLDRIKADLSKWLVGFTKDM